MHKILGALIVAGAILTAHQPVLAGDAPEVYRIDLMPPPQSGFHEKMGGWPSELTPQTFHAGTGTITVYAHNNGATDLIFDIEGLLPFGVYSLWDVTNPDFNNFADRPLMNVPDGVDGTADHWWNKIAFDPNGGPGGFGSFGFMADRRGNAYYVVNLDHRPGKEFLLDYHADGHIRGGAKGKVVFPGALWAKFPDWK